MHKRRRAFAWLWIKCQKNPKIVRFVDFCSIEKRFLCWECRSVDVYSNLRPQCSKAGIWKCPSQTKPPNQALLILFYLCLASSGVDYCKSNERLPERAVNPKCSQTDLKIKPLGNQSEVEWLCHAFLYKSICWDYKWLLRARRGCLRCFFVFCYFLQ